MGLLVWSVPLGASIGLLLRKAWGRLLFIAVLVAGIVMNIGIVFDYRCFTNMMMAQTDQGEGPPEEFTAIPGLMRIFRFVLAAVMSVLFYWIIRRLFIMPGANGFAAGTEQPLAPGISLALETGGLTPVVTVRVHNPLVDSVPDLLFEAPFDDWDPGSDSLSLKVQLWIAELQINMGRHLLVPTVEDTAMLLDNRRTIRIRWSELIRGEDFWTSDQWSASVGTLMTVAVVPSDVASSSRLSAERLNMIDATGCLCGEQSGSPTSIRELTPKSTWGTSSRPQRSSITSRAVATISRWLPRFERIATPTDGSR